MQILPEAAPRRLAHRRAREAPRAALNLTNSRFLPPWRLTHPSRSAKKACHPREIRMPSILVVEQESRYLDQIQDALAAEGYKVRVVGSQAAALQAAASQ